METGLQKMIEKSECSGGVMPFGVDQKLSMCLKREMKMTILQRQALRKGQVRQPSTRGESLRKRKVLMGRRRWGGGGEVKVWVGMGVTDGLAICVCMRMCK